MTTTPSSDLSTFLGPSPGLTRLYDNVQAVLPDVTLELIKMQAWNTIEEFYLRSTVRREIVYWNLAPNVQTLDFNPFDSDWQVAWVLSLDGLTNYRIAPPAQIVDLTALPTSTRNGSALLALKPASYSANLPDEIFQQWFETLLDGTLWRLYRTPMKPYSSPQLAAFHASLYLSGVSRARAVASAGFTNGGGRWAYPYFARGRRKN